MDISDLTDKQIGTLVDITGTDQWHQIETQQLLDQIELHIEYLRDVMHGPALASRIFVLRNIARKINDIDPPHANLDVDCDTQHWQCPKCPNHITTHLRGTIAWCHRHAGGLVPMTQKADR